MGKKKNAARLRRISEIVFDLTAGVEYALAALDEQKRNTLMDKMGGSRELFTHIYESACAFEVQWADDEVMDYLDEVDTWCEALVGKLFSEYGEKADKIVGIEIAPVRQVAPDSYEKQPDGPTAETTHWSVYDQYDTGRVEWAVDCRDEQLAMQVAGIRAKQHNVAVPVPRKGTAS